MRTRNPQHIIEASKQSINQSICQITPKAVGGALVCWLLLVICCCRHQSLSSCGIGLITFHLSRIVARWMDWVHPTHSAVLRRVGANARRHTCEPTVARAGARSGNLGSY